MMKVSTPESHSLNQLFYILFWLRRAFQETLVARDLRHKIFLGKKYSTSGFPGIVLCLDWQI